MGESRINTKSAAKEMVTCGELKLVLGVGAGAGTYACERKALTMRGGGSLTMSQFQGGSAFRVIKLLRDTWAERKGWQRREMMRVNACSI